MRADCDGCRSGNCATPEDEHKLTIGRLAPGEPPPWELLLLADPSLPRVEAQLAEGTQF